MNVPVHKDERECYECYETGNYVTSATRKAGVQGIWNTPLADNLPTRFGDSMSHYGDKATVKERDFHVTANPGFECNIPR